MEERTPVRYDKGPLPQYRSCLSPAKALKMTGTTPPAPPTGALVARPTERTQAAKHRLVWRRRRRCLRRCIEG